MFFLSWFIGAHTYAFHLLFFIRITVSFGRAYYNQVENNVSHGGYYTPPLLTNLVGLKPSYVLSFPLVFKLHGL
jgi:hypothetical protein